MEISKLPLQFFLQFFTCILLLLFFLALKIKVIRTVFEILASSIRTFLHMFWRETNFARSPLCTYEGGPLTSKAYNSTQINVNCVFLFTVVVSSISERRKVP